MIMSGLYVDFEIVLFYLFSNKMIGFFSFEVYSVYENKKLGQLFYKRIIIFGLKIIKNFLDFYRDLVFL